MKKNEKEKRNEEKAMRKHHFDSVSRTAFCAHDWIFSRTEQVVNNDIEDNKKNRNTIEKE